MKIGTREIGPGEPPYVIAEIGVNHDGEIARALELTEAAARAGADAVKLQYFKTDRLLSKAAKLAAYQKAAGETDPVAMLRRLELSLDEMALVVDRAHELGIHAIVTVFSVELVKPASELAWDAYKSASPDVINRPLLKELAETGKPLIVSTGASTLDEVVRAVGWLDGIRDRLALLQCVSCYPAPEDGTGGFVALSERFNDLLPVGYSDHTGSCGAVMPGAVIYEKHLTYDTSAQGPDHIASLNPTEFQRYVENNGSGRWISSPEHRKYLPAIVAMRKKCQVGDVSESDIAVFVQKDVLECEQDVREVARQSLVTTRDLVPGKGITREDLTLKRPGTGIEPCRLDEVIGKRLARDVGADTPLTEDDLA